MVALVAVQAVAIGIYLGVERSRDRASAKEVFRVEKVGGEKLAPDIMLERADGTRVSVHGFGSRIRLVHFWATWCPPCVEELPGLLAAAAEFADRGLTVAAISMDGDWAAIRDFFKGDIPHTVYRAVESDGHERYDIFSLPDTYLVSRDGWLLSRYGGARDWASKSAREHLRRVLEP
ncbi:MAG: TlpA family protein disulfide reductase [Proteobacteria bacterium]|nr:TlpA family protein disulfide reductase [Pseudomonadota bacterium]